MQLFETFSVFTTIYLYAEKIEKLSSGNTHQQRVLGNSTEWIFDIRRLDRAQKGGFHYPYWILGRRKVNKCTEMDENKVESGKIP